MNTRRPSMPMKLTFEKLQKITQFIHILHRKQVYKLNFLSNLKQNTRIKISYLTPLMLEYSVFAQFSIYVDFYYS